MSIYSTGASRDPEIPGTAAKPLAVTFKAAKGISGLGLTTLWGLAKEKRIETVRIGRRTLITFASLERLLTPVAAAGGEATRTRVPRSAARRNQPR